MKTYNKIILISEARSGSHYLMDIICKNIGITYEESYSCEPLNIKYEKNFKNINIIDYLNNHKGIILSIHISQLKNLNIKTNFLIENLKNCQFIVLNRVNKLEQYISNQLAIIENNWKDKTYNSKFGICLQSYYKYTLNLINDYNKILLEFEQSSSNCFAINYNNNFEKNSLISLMKFLKIKGDYYDNSYFKKQRNKNINQYLTNPEVLKNIKTIKYEL